MADGASGLAPLTDPVGTLHTEEVMAARDEGGDHLALEADGAIAAALSARPG